MTIRRLRQAILLLLSLVLVLASVSYSSVLQRGYVVVKFAALLIGATGLLALCGYVLGTGKRWKELRDPFFYLLVAELGALVVSIAFSGQPMVSLLGSMPRLMGSITIACFVVAAVAVVVGVGRRRENLLLLLRVIGVTGAAVAANAIYEWPTHFHFRPPGLVGNAEFLSNYLLFGSLGSLGLLLVERRKGWVVMAMLTASISAVGMSVLRTRGAWLGFGAGVAVFILLVYPWQRPAELVAETRKRLLLLCATAVGVAVAVALYGVAKAIKPIGFHVLLPFLPVLGMGFLTLPWVLPSIRYLRHALLVTIVVLAAFSGWALTTQSSIVPHEVGIALRLTKPSTRGIVRDDTVSMLKKHWLFGCGIENFRVAFLEFKSERVARGDPRVNYRNPHNMLLYEWTANGLLGMLTYLGLIIVGIWSLLLARRKEPDSPWALLAGGLLATLAAYLVHNYFNYDVIPTGLLFYVFLAVAVVLRQSAGVSVPEAAEPEAAEPEQTPAAEPARGKRKKRRKQGSAAPTGRTRRAALREAEQQQQDGRWRIFCLGAGLSGIGVMAILFYGLDSVGGLFKFAVSELQSEEKTDVLPWILMLSWVGLWTIALFSPSPFRTRDDSDDGEDVLLPSHTWFALAPLLALSVGLGVWWSGQQLKADWNMFRALAYSKGAGSQLIPKLQQIDQQLRQIADAERRLQRQGDGGGEADRLAQSRRRLEYQQAGVGRMVQRLLKKVQEHGSRGARAVHSLGYYHFQYSKALHPFLRARSALPDYNKIVLTSLRHAQRSVRNNTNPESAWSHLSVVYLACGNIDLQGVTEQQYKVAYALKKNNLANAKRALARSINYDKFYYDTHRMMALLHLQSGHIDEALKEMNRSLDITEQKHWFNAHTAAVELYRAMRKGDEEKADKARKRLWMWIRRSLYEGPMYLSALAWLSEEDHYRRLFQVSQILVSGKLKEAGVALLRLAKARGLKSVPSQDLRYLRGLQAVLVGDSRVALRLLREYHRAKLPENFIDTVVELVTAIGRIQSDIKRMLEVASADSRSAAAMHRRVLHQIVERALAQRELYMKIIGYHIAELIDSGDDQQAKKLAQGAAQLANLLYQRRREDYFPNEFRRLYRQVIAAKEQVEGAATKNGRLMRARMMLQRRDYQATLRIADGALKRFKDAPAAIHFLKGAALEGLRRRAEAVASYRRYLTADPNGKYADQVKARVQQLDR
ncbi:MAG: O-antigen ligase family protein [bacterium]